MPKEADQRPGFLSVSERDTQCEVPTQEDDTNFFVYASI